MNAAFKAAEASRICRWKRLIKSSSFGAFIYQKSHGKRSFITGYLLMGSCPY
jgi:hypothetical protein